MKALIEIPTVGMCPICEGAMKPMCEHVMGDQEKYRQLGWECEVCSVDVTYVAKDDIRTWDELLDGEIEIIIEIVT